MQNEPKQQRLGLIHVYHGNGKGKTTAAVGLAIRAAGRGKQVLFAQFMKGGQTGELTIFAEIPNITILRKKTGAKFSFRMTEEEKEALRTAHLALWQEIMAHLQNQPSDLLVLDEMVGALAKGFFPEDLLREFLQNKPEALEVVLTGRNPAGFLLEAADYVTEMQEIKHPYQQGIPARIGIEK